MKEWDDLVAAFEEAAPDWVQSLREVSEAVGSQEDLDKTVWACLLDDLASLHDVCGRMAGWSYRLLDLTTSLGEPKKPSEALEMLAALVAAQASVQEIVLLTARVVHSGVAVANSKVVDSLGGDDA